MADEPTNGELARGIAELRRVVEQGFGKVLTIDVWKAERESIELRLRENEKDIASLEASARIEKEKREAEKTAADLRASSNRRQAWIAILTSIIGPLFVGVVLAVFLKG